MSDIRFNPIDNRYVIISVERSQRPSDYNLQENGVHVTSPDTCPFCEGNEANTPPEVFSIRNNKSGPDQKGWMVRVVPNKFGVLDSKENSTTPSKDLISMTRGFGFHEVVVESTDHVRSLSQFTAEQISLVFQAYQNRIGEISPHVKDGYVSVFKNHKYEAGASLSHSHSQIIATPYVPADVTNRMENLKHYYIKNKRCMICDILKTEVSLDSRIVSENEKFIVLVPYWSAMPFEVSVIPRHHSHDFLELTKGDLLSLAKILKSYLISVFSLIGDIPYNMMLSLMPVPGDRFKMDDMLINSFHWRLRVLPRVNKIAGFELLTGSFINTTSPEDAADVLKNKIKSIINK